MEFEEISVQWYGRKREKHIMLVNICHPQKGGNISAEHENATKTAAVENYIHMEYNDEND
jgi:hypothetical protein